MRPAHLSSSGGTDPSRMQTPVGTPPECRPHCEQTDRCKNITLPQTSFARDKKGNKRKDVVGRNDNFMLLVI